MVVTEQLRDSEDPKVSFFISIIFMGHFGNFFDFGFLGPSEPFFTQKILSRVPKRLYELVGNQTSKASTDRNKGVMA